MSEPPRVSEVRSRIPLLVHQGKYALLAYSRNPTGTFFTIVLPLMFLVIFTTINGNNPLPGGGRLANLYVPGILALAIISATTLNLAVTMTISRERGLLKRVRGTPLPAWVFVLGQSAAGVALSLVMMFLVTLVGLVFYGVQVRFAAIPSLLVTVLLGAAAFSAIGLAFTAVIPTEDAAAAITNAVLLPLYFISDVFIIAGSTLPSWLKAISEFFPIRHFSEALQACYDPTLSGIPFPWQNWLVITLWGVCSGIVANRWFGWSPRR